MRGQYLGSRRIETLGLPGRGKKDGVEAFQAAPLVRQKRIILMHVVEQEPKDDQTSRNSENPGKQIFHVATSNGDVSCCTVEVDFRVKASPALVMAVPSTPPQPFRATVPVPDAAP